MRILIVNDDGIRSPGIIRLAELAAEFGEVWVIAPDGERSASSQRITVRDRISVNAVDFPGPVKKAWSISGTPADCVKVGLAHILDFKPDYVFSGINNGYNAGGDVLYSGTVGAAIEALVQGIPAIAYSVEMGAPWGALNEHISPVTRKLLDMKISPEELWNVNFPGIEKEECAGVLWDRTVAPWQFYENTYEAYETESGIELLAGGIRHLPPEKEDDSDLCALSRNYVSIGKIRCMANLV